MTPKLGKEKGRRCGRAGAEIPMQPTEENSDEQIDLHFTFAKKCEKEGIGEKRSCCGLTITPHSLFPLYHLREEEM